MVSLLISYLGMVFQYFSTKGGELLVVFQGRLNLIVLYMAGCI